MKKNLLLLFALFVSFGLYAEDIPFDQYGNVLLSDYENYADNQTVIITLKISSAGGTGPGWGVGTIKPINSSGDATYNFACKDASAEGAVNEYEFTIAEFKNLAKVGGEYFVDQYGQKGLTINVYNGATRESIVVKNAAPTAVIDFESDALGTKYPIISINENATPDDITATVESRPGGEGQALHIINKQWNTYPQFLVAFPEGKTLADVEKISFELYFESVDVVGDQTPNSYKEFRYFFGGEGTTFTAAGASTGNLVAGPSDNPVKTWLKKDFVPTIDATLLPLNKFEFGLGLHINAAGNYFLDNITFKLKEVATGITEVKQDAANGDIIVYGIDGRLIKQVVGNQILSLEKGLYIIKKGAGKAEKILVQ